MKHSNRLKLLAAASVISIASLAQAEDRTWLGGGLWQNAGAWSPAGVPTGDDVAILPSSQSGNVSIVGVAIVDQLHIDGPNYNITGTPGSQLQANYIHFREENTQLTVPVIVGRDSQGTGRAILEISGDGYMPDIFSAINGPGNVPFDAYLEGNYHNQIAGVDNLNVVFGEMSLTGGAYVQDATNINVTNATFILDTENSPSGNPRIVGNTNLRLDKSKFQVTPSLNGAHIETFKSFVAGGGTNEVEIMSDVRVRVGGAGTINRDANSRGTMRISGDGVLEGPIGLGSEIVYTNGSATEHLVPWMSRNGRPVSMNYGPDNIPGNGDDDGPVEVDTELWNVSTANSHVYMNEDVTLPGGSNPQRRSLTMEDGITLDLNAGTLDLESGVFVGIGSTTFAGSNGSVRIINGREGIFHLYGFGGTFRSQAHLISNNGLTFSSTNFFTTNTVRLENTNTVAGPVVMNHVNLELAVNNAIPSTSTLKLLESSLKLDFNGGNFDTPITFNTGASSAFSGGSVIYEIKLKDNFTYNATGLWQGRGPMFIKGTNSVLQYTNTQTPTVGGDMSIWPQAGTTFEVNGTLGNRSVGQDGAVILFDGTLAGTGHVTNIQASSGIVSPGTNAGNNVGVLHTDFLGVFGSTFHFQLNGTGFGTGYDAVQADDFAYFTNASTIQTIASSFVGQIGQTFDLFRYANHFTASKPALSIAQAVQSGGQWISYYDQDSFTIGVAGPTGDANLDGHVNFDDLLVLAQNYGQTDRNWITGDFTGDGVANFDDLLLIAQRYGQSALAANGLTSVGEFTSDWTLAQSLAPEPTMLVLPAMASTCLRRRRTV